MPDVAGLRVLRLLARGERADSMVAFDPGDDAPGAGSTGAGSTAAESTADGRAEPVVIKRFHPTTPPADVARELEALARAAGDHVVALRDVGSESGCACLVFDRLPGADLSTLLRMRGSLDAGEAVTVLAPLASALARMHTAGVAHGRVSASSILFTADGSPTLVGFGGAELFAPGSPEVVLESVPAVAADREALRVLTVSLLERCSDSAGATLELTTAVGRAAPHELADLVSSRIFELGTPAPVRFEPDEAGGSSRVVAIADPTFETIPVNSARMAGVLARWEPLARLLEQDVVVRLRGELAKRWRALAPRSRRLVIAGLAGIGVLVVALAATPTPPASPKAPPAATPAASHTAPTPELSGDDPIAAAAVLLVLRDECLRSASLLCLDGVVQAGSSAEATDRATVGDIQNGAEAPAPIAAQHPELVERLGDTALVSLGHATGGETAPASLLLMKGEAGWRIRDYLIPIAEIPRS